jgi:hypothetical protein
MTFDDVKLATWASQAIFSLRCDASVASMPVGGDIVDAGTIKEP